MKNIGQSNIRNEEYKKLFSREKLIQHLVTNKSPVIFDIGAHHGESVKYLKDLFPKSAIYSFEPDPDSFKVLSSKLIEGVSYYNQALSNNEGTATFFRNKISHTNSLFKVNLNSKDSIGIRNAKVSEDKKYLSEFNSEFHVNTTTLDSFTKRHSIEIVDILKLDVQGAECRVLSGGQSSLKKTKVIVLEISFFDYYEHQTSFLDVELLLSPLGYKLYSISEISNNPMNGRTDWVETVYVNTNLLALEHCS
jgi:FkbM family methyltransferase